MPSRIRSRLAAALLAGAAAAPASVAAQTIATDPGAPFVATALTGFATTANEMTGMQVTTYFSDGSSAAGAWGDLGAGLWGVSLPGFQLLLGDGVDTFGGAMTFLNLSGQGVTRLVLEGAPGRTVFDVLASPFGSDGSAQGRPMEIVGGDTFGTTATYRNIVSIGATPAFGDLFATLDITFAEPDDVGPNGFQFVADTDNVGFRGTVTQTPEPATFALMATGALALAGATRVRRRNAA